MRTTSYIAVGGLAVGLGLFEGSMIGSLPHIFIFIHPILPFLVLFLLLKRPQAAYITAAVSGMVVDLISSTPSGFAMARWLVVAFVLDLVAENVITNRSIYGAWILVILARVVELVILGVTLVFYEFILERVFILHEMSSYLYVGVVDLIVITTLFLLISVFTKRFLTFIPFIKGRYGG